MAGLPGRLRGGLRDGRAGCHGRPDRPGRRLWWHDWRDALAVVALETLPAAVGASYARSQLGQASPQPQQQGYGHELFLMTAGAVVFAANVAPTEEIVLLAAEATPWHGLALVALGLLLMHAFVYRVGFR